MDKGEPADDEPDPSRRPRGRPKKRSFQGKRVKSASVRERIKNHEKDAETVKENISVADRNSTDQNSIKSVSIRELQELYTIRVLSITTDTGEQQNTDGRWHYYNAAKCIVRYTCIGMENEYSVNLQNLLERGIPKYAKQSVSFRWYSWTRFKSIARNKNIPLVSAVSEENKFLYLLKETSNYYTKNVLSQKSEGLEQNRGPQSFLDASNLQLLHYYGKGTIKYYRRTTFLHLLAEKHGENVKAEFLVHPTTPLISSIDYEEILQDVHSQLTLKFKRHLSKLQKYAGPQCEEDRINQTKVNYDVKFTSTSSKAHTNTKVQAEISALSEPEQNELELKEFYLRKCEVCTKIRWIGEKAARKFILGSYSYSGTSRLVSFRCDLLHNTSCDEDEDILPVYEEEGVPSLWIAYLNSQEIRLPPVAIVLKNLSQVSEGIYDTEILAKYACNNSDLKDFNCKAVSAKVHSQKVEFGKVLTTGRFQRFSEIPIMNLAKVMRRVPREALVCQSWFDNCTLSSEDPSAVFSVNSLTGIRDLHATYGAMKIIQCSQCGMCSPGFDANVNECITVPENGKYVPLANDALIKALKESKVLSNSAVTLASKFENFRDYSEGKVTGICTECEKFCEINEQGCVTLKHTSRSQEVDSQGSQEPINDNISNINPYSIENLMALDVYQNEASHQYAMFMDTLTQAEKLVLSPIHAVIVILRSRTNNIPFSRHGSISFQMKQPVKTKSLPWHTFERLPFVVMVSANEDGSVEEAKVNMAKIVHAKELMEREVVCPVYGTKRPFYRYCDKIHTPFTVEAMETLASQLSDTNTAVPPSGLRKINTALVHERSTKPLNCQLFSEWLNAGFVIGNGLKDAFIVFKNYLTSVSHEMLTKQLWEYFSDFVQAKKDETSGTIQKETSETMRITPTDVMKCAIEKGWLNPKNDIAVSSPETEEEMLTSDGDFSKLLFLCCEELELVLRESSNDEGDEGNVAHGGVVNVQGEGPEDILTEGVRNTVLERIPAPQVDRDNPVPENSPGYLQMAFPDVFLTGDGCPHQQRPRNVKNVSGNYLFKYYQWVIQQPRAMVSTELQFLINSMIKRQHSRIKAKLALRSNKMDKHEIPVKEDLMKNAELREWTATNLMMFKSAIPDSTPFWKRSRDDAIAVQRDWEEEVPWRPEKTRMSIMLFQTRAPPYNHHPAIHRVCPNSEEISLLSDEEYLEARRRNVLKYPSIISFMCALIAELDTKYLAKVRYDGDSYFTRFEWGANANPHSHRLLFSRKFSSFINSLKQGIDTCIDNLKEKTDLADPVVQETIRTKALDCWDSARKDYIDFMRPFYTNWNAGLLSDGKTKTFDYIYERKSTVCRVDMASVIDHALSSGSFIELDTIYVSVVNGTCRHLGHSGINDQPAKPDKCAVIKKKKIKSNVAGKKEYKEVVTCKRRKPHLVGNFPSIEPDPHNKKLFQLQFESNDKWFNGHDPFEVLHILSNADDKAIVPDFLRKPPTLEFVSEVNDENSVQWDVMATYYSEIGDTATEYVTKYAFKDVINTKTSSEVLVTAMENLQDGEQINQGTVQKMYNTHAIAGTTSIFQASHLNMKIPLAISNVSIKHCSLSGLSLLRSDYDPRDGDDYVIPPLLNLFNRRHEDTIICKEQGKLSHELKSEIQKDMCLHQFCDLYDVKEIKNDEGTRQLLFKKRLPGRSSALKLIPCHGLKVANPNNKLHWNFCRTLCLWKIPCHVTTDLTPAGEDDETIKKGWIQLFQKTFINGTGLPPWAYRFWKHYNVPRSHDTDESSDEDEQSQPIDVNSKHAEATDNDINNSAEDICAIRPRAQSGKEPFYQNPVDRWRACPQTAFREQETDITADTLANPEGVDFMNIWLGDRILPPVLEIHTKLANLINAEDTSKNHYFSASTLNEKQRMVHDMVVDYVKRRVEWDEIGHTGPPPTPLRLFMMGNPGTGKSWTLKCFISTLINTIENTSQGNGKPEWQNRIKLAAPTGAASSQMHFKSETLHRLFCIPIHLTDQTLRLDEKSAAYSRLVLNFDPEKFTLLVVDEFSMVSRQMFAFITERLQQCNIDLQRIGIVLIGDPAQILPIGADPLWSSRIHNDNGKDCNSLSIIGMSRFRQVFNLPPLQTIEGYEQWRQLKDHKDRITSEIVQAFRKKSFVGDFDAVFLTEVKRTETDHVSKEFTTKVLVNLRYGAKCREKEIDFLRNHCASKTDIQKNEDWKTAHVIHGYHFHSPEHTNRGSVEADNAIALLKHHKATGNPIMRIDSIHCPSQKEDRLKAISAKEFEGAPASWHACQGMRVMLLRNVAPSLGLYNGSIHTLVGPIYNNDSIEVSLTLEHLKSASLEGCTTTTPIDTCGKEKQIPAKSVLLSVNGQPYDEIKFDQLPTKEQMQCKFKRPQNPPTLPDFMVIEASNYFGPNILKLSGCDNFVPIAPVENYRKLQTKSTQTRIALPLEGGDAATGFKGQGANYPLAEVDIEGWFHVPGFFLVAISRVRSPAYLHLRAFPNYMDIKLQRLKENVLDAQAFEEAVRVKSESLYRHREQCEDEFWNSETNLIADTILIEAVGQKLSIKRDDVKLLERVKALCTNKSTNVILEVMHKMIETREYLLAEAAPHLDPEDYQTLVNYQKKRSVTSKVLPDKSNKQEQTSRQHMGPSKTWKQYDINNVSSVTKPWEENMLLLRNRPDINNGETFKGLQNSGNNLCFLNAAVISLCHTESFDTMLRQCHDMHHDCTGDMFGVENVCPLCALYEVVNRAYRNHTSVWDISKMPIIKLTRSLLEDWHLGMEHDADEFLTKLLDRLDVTIGCEIHKGIIRTDKECSLCKGVSVKQHQQLTPIRILIHLSEFPEEEISIQDGVNRWQSSEQQRRCHTCGEELHVVQRAIIVPPNIIIINILRFGSKRTTIDHQVEIGNHTYTFKSSINYHPHHYTAVGSAGSSHYTFYSDEEVQTCHGSLTGSEQNHRSMNRVRGPLEELSTVLIYERTV